MYPVLFKIHGFEVHTFGLVMVVAFVTAITLAQRRAAKYGLTKNQIGDVSFWTLLAGVLGARIVFIAQDLGYYLHHTNELFSLKFQGLTSFGGLLFGMAALIIWARAKKVPILNLLDLFAPLFVLGHAIGRIGCLMNGCCFGGVCPQTLPWGIHVEGSALLHHPAQAYDSLMNLAVFGILMLADRKKLHLGQLTGLALALHGTTRIIYEFWRAGTDAQVDRGLASSTYWGSMPFTQAQAMAAVLVLAGIVMFVVFAKKKAPIFQGDLNPA